MTGMYEIAFSVAKFIGIFPVYYRAGLCGHFSDRCRFRQLAAPFDAIVISDLNVRPDIVANLPVLRDSD